MNAPTEGDAGSEADEYMHIGETMTRFLSVTSRILRGRKRVGVVLAVGLSAAPGSLAGVKYGIPWAPVWAGEGAVARSVIVIVLKKKDERI